MCITFILKTFSLLTKSNLMHIMPWSEDLYLKTFNGLCNDFLEQLGWRQFFFNVKILSCQAYKSQSDTKDTVCTIMQIHSSRSLETTCSTAWHSCLHHGVWGVHL